MFYINFLINLFLPPESSAWVTTTAPSTPRSTAHTEQGDSVQNILPKTDIFGAMWLSIFAPHMEDHIERELKWSNDNLRGAPLCHLKACRFFLLMRTDLDTPVPKNQSDFHVI